MCGNTVDGNLEPRATFVRAADTVVGGFGIKHPALLANPAGCNDTLNTTHVSLFVNGKDGGKRFFGERAGAGNGVTRISEGKKRAGKTAFHIA